MRGNGASDLFLAHSCGLPQNCGCMHLLLRACTHRVLQHTTTAGPHCSPSRTLPSFGGFTPGIWDVTTSVPSAVVSDDSLGLRAQEIGQFEVGVA